MAKKKPAPKKTEDADPAPDRYEACSKAELYQIAKEMGIEGRSRMARGELLRVLRKR